MTGKERYAPFYRLIHADPPARRGVPATVVEFLLLREGDDEAQVVSTIEVERTSYIARRPWVARARVLGHPAFRATFEGERLFARFAEARDFAHALLRRFVEMQAARGGVLMLPWDDETPRAVTS